MICKETTVIKYAADEENLLTTEHKIKFYNITHKINAYTK